MGYVPNDGLPAKVVFISKFGKRDYTEPKTFRPTSLTSFLMKTLERMIDRYLTKEVLIRTPLNTGKEGRQIRLAKS